MFLSKIINLRSTLHKWKLVHLVTFIHILINSIQIQFSVFFQFFHNKFGEIVIFSSGETFTVSNSLLHSQKIALCVTPLKLIFRESFIGHLTNFTFLLLSMNNPVTHNKDLLMHKVIIHSFDSALLQAWN